MTLNPSPHSGEGGRRKPAGWGDLATYPTRLLAPLGATLPEDGEG
jgi:hypothetical protein